MMLMMSREYLQLIGERESLLLQHVEDAGVLLLDRVALHQLEVCLVNLILKEPQPLALCALLHDVLHLVHFLIGQHNLEQK